MFISISVYSKVIYCLSEDTLDKSNIKKCCPAAWSIQILRRSFSSKTIGMLQCHQVFKKAILVQLSFIFVCGPRPITCLCMYIILLQYSSLKVCSLSCFLINGGSLYALPSLDREMSLRLSRSHLLNQIVALLVVTVPHVHILVRSTIMFRFTKI